METKDSNIGALIIRIGFRGPLYSILLRPLEYLDASRERATSTCPASRAVVSAVALDADDGVRQTRSSV